MTTTDAKDGKRRGKEPKGPDPMRPEVRKAFEESYARNKEAMRRLAKL